MKFLFVMDNAHVHIDDDYECFETNCTYVYHKAWKTVLGKQQFA